MLWGLMWIAALVAALLPAPSPFPKLWKCKSLGHVSRGAPCWREPGEFTLSLAEQDELSPLPLPWDSAPSPWRGTDPNSGTRAWGKRLGMSKGVGTGAALVSPPVSNAATEVGGKDPIPMPRLAAWALRDPHNPRKELGCTCHGRSGRRTCTWPPNETNLSPKGQTRRRTHDSRVSPCSIPCKAARGPADAAASPHITAWHCGATTINTHSTLSLGQFLCQRLRLQKCTCGSTLILFFLLYRVRRSEILHPLPCGGECCCSPR